MRLSPFDLLDGWLAPAPDPARTGWLRGGAFAHRGMHGAGRTENSLSAAAAAVERGLGIECDVHQASDGQPVVFHDFELDRLTAETGLLARRTAEELSRIPLRGTADTIPTLQRLLDMIDGRVPILIEVKSRGKRQPIGALCLAVRRTLQGYIGPHAVMSFDPRVSRWFARHSPPTLRGLVVSEGEDRALPGRVRRVLALWHAKPQFLAYDIRDLPSRFPARQRRRGLPVVTWTVRTAEHLERARLHADSPIMEGSITERPIAGTDRP